MIARLDHHPMLTALLALSTAVLVVVVISLSALLYTSAPAVSPPNIGGGHYGSLSGDAGSTEGLSQAPGTSAEQHAQVVAVYTGGRTAPESILDQHARMVAAYTR
jgi:hypothetical protein